MRSVVIVQTARTPMGKACRGAFNALPLAAHAVRGALARAMASHMVRRKGGEIALAGGVESISLVQNSHWNAHEYRAAWMPTRHGISRAAQDAYALQSQPRTAAAQRGALFADEIIPIETQKVETHKNVTDKQSGISDTIPVRLTGDECNRPGTSLEGLAALTPVKGPSGTVTAGNASQLSDGAAALPMMSQDEARRRDLRPLARCGAFAWRGSRPKRWASVRSRRSRVCCAAPVCARTRLIFGRSTKPSPGICGWKDTAPSPAGAWYPCALVAVRARLACLRSIERPL